jgi:hypothetical protein
MNLRLGAECYVQEWGRRLVGTVREIDEKKQRVKVEVKPDFRSIHMTRKWYPLEKVTA